jgi:hypothetical protein
MHFEQKYIKEKSLLILIVQHCRRKLFVSVHPKSMYSMYNHI